MLSTVLYCPTVGISNTQRISVSSHLETSSNKTSRHPSDLRHLCIGDITLPVGNNLFAAIKAGRTSLAKTCMLWYYAVILI